MVSTKIVSIVDGEEIVLAGFSQIISQPFSVDDGAWFIEVSDKTYEVESVTDNVHISDNHILYERKLYLVLLTYLEN